MLEKYQNGKTAETTTSKLFDFAGKMFTTWKDLGFHERQISQFWPWSTF